MALPCNVHTPAHERSYTVHVYEHVIIIIPDVIISNRKMPYMDQVNYMRT